MMPVARVETVTRESGKPTRVFTAMGAPTDLVGRGIRRRPVNATDPALGLAGRRAAGRDVSIVGAYNPHRSGDDEPTEGFVPEDVTGR